MKKYIIIIFLTLSSFVGFTQQQPLYSQYMLNTYLINPSVAGSEGLTMFNLTSRQQWIGYEQSPKTYTLNFQTRILKTSFYNRSRLVKNRVKKRRPSGKIGVGGMIYNDVNGKIRRTGLQGTYSYHIYVKDVQISFGASISIYQFGIDIKPSDLYYPNDPLVTNGLNKFSPDANVGIMFSTEKYYYGISATSLFQSSIQFGNGNPNDSYRILRQYYLIGGYRFEPYRSDYAIEPSILLTTTERFGYSIDLNTKLYYRQDYWAGISYRSVGAVILMFGVKYEQFVIGYAYDYNYSDLSTISKIGSHELMISYKIGSNLRRYRWLNRF